LIEEILISSIECRKTDNNYMHMGFASGFTTPGKRSIREVNFDVEIIEKQRPNQRNLFTLSNRIGGYKSHFDGCALNVLSRFVKPGHNVVQIPNVLVVTEHGSQITFL